MALDPVLGTFALRGTTTVTSSGAVPAGVAALGLHNQEIYAVMTDFGLRRLGTLPTLTPGSSIVDVRAPADRAAMTFLGDGIASNGQQIITGYTNPAQGGAIALTTPTDGGVTYVNAPGNYTFTGLSSGAFVINSTGLGTATGPGLYALRPQTTPAATSLLAMFPDAFGGSGYTAVTANQVLLAGNGRTDFSNVVRALAPMQYQTPVATGSSFVYTANDAPLIAEGFDVAAITSFENDAVIVRGGYDSSGPFTTNVARLPLSLLTSSGGQTVTVGVSSLLLENGGLQCTRVFAAFGAGPDLFIGLSDRQGRRLVKLAP